MKREGQKVGIYRSKLERNWALFFTQLGILFKYEPQYYYDWLPDFELMDSGVLVEIKPTLEIAWIEIPERFPGMRLAAHGRRDVVLLIGQPSISKEGSLNNIGGFADCTYNDTQSELVYFSKFWAAEVVRFVKCRNCKHYFFIGIGSGVCRICSHYDGGQGFEQYPLSHRGDYDAETE